MIRHSALVAIVALSIPAAAFAGTRRDDRSPQLYLDAATLYPSVGRIDTVAAGGRYIGSGTLISSDWVLTAGHMVDNVTSMTFNINGTNYNASSWVAHPNWEGNLSSGTDIALVHLASPIDGIAPAARYAGTSELGKVATFVGYGMTGTGLTGATSFDGQKRAGQNMLDANWRNGAKTVSSILMSDFDSPWNASESRYGSSSPLNLEYLIAPGDSGGGVFIDINNSTYLAGVNSFGASWDGSTNSDYGDVSGVIRVSAFNSWIDSVLDGSYFTGGKGGGGKPGRNSLETSFDPSLGATVPEPATLILLAGALPILALRRRRS